MKIIKYICIVLAVVLTNTACESDLDIAPEDRFTAGSYYRDAADLEGAVNAAYGGLQKNGLYGFNYHFLMETRTDNTFEEEPSNSGGFGDVDLFNRVTTNGVFKSTWVDSYVTIQAANIVLNRIDGISDMDAATTNSRKGEAKFIRALIYYNLVNLYGDVPLVTMETTNPTDYFGQTRTAVAEVYTQIITDLIEAAEQLPSSNGEGRATKGAANTLLGKVYLANNSPELAEMTLRKVIGEYTWANSYIDIFGVANENGPESIFEVQFESNVNGNSEGSAFAAKFTAQSNPGSKGNNLITQDLIASFEASDLRRNEIISDRENALLHISNKYVDDNRSVLEDGSNNVIVLRYTDVLLSLAEALNMQSYAASGEAFDLLNTIRTRAGIPNLDNTTLTNKTEFTAALLEERRHEFFHELHRWFDLKRIGDPVAVMNAHFLGTGNTIDIDDLLLPIPQAQIDSDPDYMTQNPGY